MIWRSILLLILKSMIWSSITSSPPTESSDGPSILNYKSWCEGYALGMEVCCHRIVVNWWPCLEVRMRHMALQSHSFCHPLSTSFKMSCKNRQNKPTKPCKTIHKHQPASKYRISRQFPAENRIYSANSLTTPNCSRK